MAAWTKILTALNPFTRIERTLEQIMAAIDDLKALFVEIQASIGNIATDVDTLIGLVSQPSPDLTEVIATATAIRDRLAAVDAKFPTA